jgi:membrane protein DedA with SNARE-associated domain
VSKAQSELIKKLNKNLSDYFKIITIIVLFFFFVLLLLIRDLRKKSKKEYRDKYLISMILNKND